MEKVIATPKTIGKKLKELRGDVELREISQYCAISITALANYEKDKQMPSIANLTTLARHYNRDIIIEISGKEFL